MSLPTRIFSDSQFPFSSSTHRRRPADGPTSTPTYQLAHNTSSKNGIQLSTSEDGHVRSTWSHGADFIRKAVFIGQAMACGLLFHHPSILTPHLLIFPFSFFSPTHSNKNVPNSNRIFKQHLVAIRWIYI